MRVRKMSFATNPMRRWRWDAAGLYGYCATEAGALRAARRATERNR